MLTSKGLFGSDGFSLIEVLLAAMLLGIVSVGMTAMMTALQAEQNGVKWRLSADAFTEEMRLLLSSERACTNSFGGLMSTAGASHTLTDLKDESPAPGKVKYPLGLVFGDGSVRLTSLTLTKFSPGKTTSQAQMTLIAGLQALRSASGAQSIKRELNVNIEMNGTNRVATCLAAAKMADGIWQRVAPLDPDNGNIFFMNQTYGGLVGINTDQPMTNLDVAGPTRATTLANRDMPMALIPNTEGLGGYYQQGMGFNLDFDRTNAIYSIGGDAAGTGAAAILIDHGAGALQFFTIPSVGASAGYSVNPSWLQTQERMRLDSAGHLGIGVTNPTYALHLSTDSAAKPGTGAWTIASDERLKDLGPSYTRGLDAVLKLRPRYYRYRAGNALNLPSAREYVGPTAQNVRRGVPEAVSTDEQGFLHVTNDAIQWALLNAIRELSAEHDQLRAEYDAVARAAQ